MRHATFETGGRERPKGGGGGASWTAQPLFAWTRTQDEPRRSGKCGYIAAGLLHAVLTCLLRAAPTCLIRATRACAVLDCWRHGIAWQRSPVRCLLLCVRALREKENFQLFHFVQPLKMVQFLRHLRSSYYHHFLLSNEVDTHLVAASSSAMSAPYAPRRSNSSTSAFENMFDVCGQEENETRLIRQGGAKHRDEIITVMLRQNVACLNKGQAVLVKKKRERQQGYDSRTQKVKSEKWKILPNTVKPRK